MGPAFIPGGNKVLWCADGNTCNIPIGITGNTVIEFGRGVANKEGNAGKIGYGTFDSNGSLNIVGAGTTSSNRTVRIWDNAVVNGTLNVNGTALNIGGADNLRLKGDGNNRLLQSYGGKALNINTIGNDVNIGKDTGTKINLNGNVTVSGALQAGNTQFKVYDLTGTFGAALPTANIDVNLPSGVTANKVLSYYGITVNGNDQIPWDYRGDNNWVVNSYLKPGKLSYRNTGNSTRSKSFRVVFIVKP